MTLDYQAACNYRVWCCICDTEYDEQDPAVTFHYDTHEWTCTEEGPCLERRAMTDLERTVTP